MRFPKFKLPDFLTALPGFSFSGASRAALQHAQTPCPYQQYTFTALGYLAKAEGQVLPGHIQQIEALMTSLSFSAVNRRLAIGWFNEGKSLHVEKANEHTDRKGQALNLPFQFYLLATGCAEKIENGTLLRKMCLECMCQCAWISGLPSGNTHAVLFTLADTLAFGLAEVIATESIIAERQGLNPELPESIQSASQLLEVELSASSEALKLAYRRMLSKHHPDKFSSADTDDRIRQLAEDNTRRLTEAYELISARDK